MPRKNSNLYQSPTKNVKLNDVATTEFMNDNYSDQANAINSSVNNKVVTGSSQAVCNQEIDMQNNSITGVLAPQTNNAPQIKQYSISNVAVLNLTSANVTFFNSAGVLQCTQIILSNSLPQITITLPDNTANIRAGTILTLYYNATLSTNATIVNLVNPTITTLNKGNSITFIKSSATTSNSWYIINLGSERKSNKENYNFIDVTYQYNIAVGLPPLFLYDINLTDNTINFLPALQADWQINMLIMPTNSDGSPFQNTAVKEANLQLYAITNISSDRRTITFDRPLQNFNSGQQFRFAGVGIPLKDYSSGAINFTAQNISEINILITPNINKAITTAPISSYHALRFYNNSTQVYNTISKTKTSTLNNATRLSYDIISQFGVVPVGQTNSLCKINITRTNTTYVRSRSNLAYTATNLACYTSSAGAINSIENNAYTSIYVSNHILADLSPDEINAEVLNTLDSAPTITNGLLYNIVIRYTI